MYVGACDVGGTHNSLTSPEPSELSLALVARRCVWRALEEQRVRSVRVELVAAVLVISDPLACVTPQLQRAYMDTFRVY